MIATSFGDMRPRCAIIALQGGRPDSFATNKCHSSFLTEHRRALLAGMLPAGISLHCSSPIAGVSKPACIGSERAGQCAKARGNNRAQERAAWGTSERGCRLSAPGQRHNIAHNRGGTRFRCSMMCPVLTSRSAQAPTHLSALLVVTWQTPAIPQATVSGFSSPNWHSRALVAPSQMKAVQTAAVGRMRTGLGGKGGKKSLGGSTAPQGPR